jgi:hypothetical protein
MVQLNRLERLVMGGFQVSSCFYLLENWPIRYTTVEPVCHFFSLPYHLFILICCGVLSIRCMLTLNFMVRPWDWLLALYTEELHMDLRRISSGEVLILLLEHQVVLR